MHFYREYFILNASKASNMKYKTISKQKGPPFQLLRHYETFPAPVSALWDFFQKNLNVSNGSPFIFLILCNKLDFQKPKGSPLIKTLRFLRLRYSAIFRRSVLLINQNLVIYGRNRI